MVYGESLSKPGATATVYGAYPGGTGIQYIRQGGVNFAANSGSGSLAPTRAELGTAVPYYLTDETKLLTTAYPYERTVKGEDGTLLPHYGDWLEYQLQGTELVYVEWYEGGGVGLYAAEVEADGSVKPIRNSLRTDPDAVVVRDTYRIISSMNPTLPEDTDEQLAKELPGGFKAYEIDNGNAAHARYKELVITDTEGNKAFLYNPDFACEAFAVAAATPAPTEFLEKPGVTETGASSTDVLVRSARHLANVSEYTREVPEAGGWTYTQLLNVDYEKYESPFTTGKDTDHLQTPAKLGTMGKYDGRGHLVKNLWLGEDAEGRSGLFGSVDNGAVVQDVVLVNVNVKATGTGDTGALVGYLGNGTITGCGVYCEKRDDYDTYTVSSSGTAGGLVGVLHGGSVSRSFAAVQVSGAACAGGFVGRVENGVSKAFVENCYAGGRTEGGKYGTVSAGVNVTSDVVAGGFVGDYASGSFSGVNYSTCSVGCDTAGLFAGQGPDIAKGADTDMLYATGAAFKNDGTGWASVAPRRENYLLTGSALPGGTVTQENTFNYDSFYNGARYPYASRLTTHHGDWGVPTTAGIFYWELEDGKYRFYILTWDGKEAAVEDGLCRKHACGHQVEDWGYGVFGLSGTNGDTGDNAKKALELLQNGRPAAVLAYTLPKNQTSLIEVNTGIDGKVLVCDTRFGAAIAEEEKVAELRREVRAFDQLEHVAGNGTLTFTQTHDVSAKDKVLAPLSLTGSGVYDGGFYRILDLKIDAGSGDAALFSAVRNGAAVKNVILYAPKGDGVITGANAAGIVAKLDGGTVDSCVAAGYTVSGSGNVGGLVASASENSAVKNSEATVKLKSTDASAKIGGLVGNAGGILTVENCCAGGSIDTDSGSASSIGGLVGAGTGAVTFENVYSYVDMTSAKAGKVYGIGPGTVKTDSRICEYWYAGLPALGSSTNKPVETGDKDTDGVLGVTLAQLRNDTQKLGASAEELYIPGAEGLINQITLADINDTQKYKKFPFAAFVTDRTVPGDVKNLHYGAWPTSAYAGLFYYEKEEITRLVHGTQVTETVYNYYAYGGEIYKSAMRGEKLLDGLCYDHHLTGERAGIVETGYGYFYPEGEEGIAYTLKVDKKIATGSEVPNDDPIKENLIKSLSANGDYKVFLTTPTNDYKTVEWTLEAKNGSSPVGSVAMYVNDAFGAVIAESKDIGKDDKNCLPIRTVEQLKKFLNARADLQYFAISHDIDLKNVSWTPDKAEGTLLDGCGYRVLDLNVKLETGDAGLFSSVESGMEIKNIILYSPDASGQISTKSGSAGGIAGANSGSKITNCIVSGYTITGTAYVGGIVGDAGSNATIAQCQTDVILTGEATAIGGIAGKANNAHLQKCVTGGQVYGAENDTKVGGLYGQSSGDVDVSGSYTYMDLIRTGADTVNVHAIGEKPATTSSEVFFLESMMPEEYSEAGQGTPFTIQTFPNNPNADYTFIPNDGDPFDGLAHETIDDQEYHHRTYVTVNLDPNHDKGVTAAGTFRVHYGEWPGTPHVVGVMYYEIDEEGGFTYHLMGLHLTGAEADLRGGICIERHVGENGAIEEHKIKSSGYALVNMDTTEFEDIKELPGLTEDASDTEVKALIKTALGIDKEENLLIKVYPTPETGDVSAHYSLTITSSGVASTFWYTKGFAEVSDHAFGTADQSTGRVYPYYLRTLRQLDNIPDGVPATVSFVIGHDLYGYEAGSYTGAADFCGGLDGQSYKILNLKIKDGTGDVGVIASTGAGARLSNLIVYGTEPINITAGDGAATIRGNNVGGLVGRVTGRTSVMNCAAAGQILSGTGSLGGLVGSCESLLTLENCEAASFITFTTQPGKVCAGGLLGGRTDTAQVSVVNCYAGGKIITPTGTSACVVGGLVGGSGGSVSVSGSYSYANLLDAKTGTVYAIGKDVELSDSVQYLEPYIADSVLEVNQGQGTGVFMLSEGGAGSRADWSYKEGETPIKEGNNGYHFRAVLTVDGRLEHYGPWPGLAGLMYWEISKIDGVNTFKYHFMGLDEFGNENDYSTLCHDHHTNDDGTIEEHMILTSGYAMINTCEDDRIITEHTTGTYVSVLTYDSSKFDEIETTDPVASKALHTMIDLMGFTPEKIGLTAVCNNTTQNATEFYVTVDVGTGSRTVYCTYGLAEVSEKKFGTETNPYIVRTRQQLANIDTKAHLTGKYNYKQDHDIYGDVTDGNDEAFTPIGAKSSTSKTSIAAFNGTYDGQGYRILELNIIGVYNHAALFYQTDTATIKNIIMYSPSGKAWVKVDYTENTVDNDTLNAAGISADAGQANTSIENCVVAGYTIEVTGGEGKESNISNHLLGGIAAWYMGNVKNCAVIVNFVDSAGGKEGGNTYVGGIVAQTNKGNITNCYAGGLVNKTGTIGLKMKQKVGGIVGEKTGTATADKLTIENCYSYLDLSDLIGDSALTCELHSICEKATNSTRKECYYWAGGAYGTGVTVDEGSTGLTLENLKTRSMSISGFAEADQTFVPDDVKHLEGKTFPFGTTTVEIDGVATPVHYGMWPEESPAVGAAYVEYEIPYGADASAGHLRYQGFGFSIADNSTTAVQYDNLCGSYGGGDTNQSGFVYFWLNDRQVDANIPQTKDGFIKLEDEDPFVIQVQSSLRSIFGKNYHVAVFKSAGKDYTGGNVTWTVTDSEDTSRTMSVTFDPHFAKMYESGKAADGTEHRPYIIRNALQLQNIDGKNNMYFEQTHDIECAGVKDFKPLTVSGITYKGHVYSIRNLAIDGGSGSAALFARVTDSTFDGLILDAPTADNQETALKITTAGGTAAGLAAETDGICAFTRCAAAGYDITSHGTTGGLVGVNHGELTLTSCEAVYNPMGTGYGDLTTIGGLVGENRGTLTVQNCYAGGKIFSMKAGEYHVGGLVGSHTGAGIKVANAYSYMDMSELVYDGEKKLVYAIAPEGVDWNTCRYIARGLPAGTTWTWQGGEWVHSDALGYGKGLTLFDSVVTGVKEGKQGSYTVATSLGTWLRAQKESDGWKMGQATNRALADFPFMAVITDEDGNYIHFGHSRYASFGARPYIGFFQVYGTSGQEAGLNPTQGPYYGFGWVRSEEGLIGATIPNDTPEISDDSALTEEDMNNLANITRTDDDGVKSFLPNRAVAYGLLLPRGYTIKDTGVTVVREHSDKEYDRYVEGGVTKYLPWVEHNYCVYDTNGNIIIGDFYVEAKDGKPFEIETRDIPEDRDESSVFPDPGTVQGRYDHLKDEVSKVELKNEAAFADYDLYWFTTASISGFYDTDSDPVSRSRTEFRLKFTFNYAEETIYTLPDPSAGGYPLTHELIVVTYRDADQ